MLDALNLKPEIFGLDISDLSLKVVKLKKNKKFFSVSCYGETPMKSGIISGGEIKNQSALSEVIKSAIKNVKGEKIKTEYAVVSLPEEKSFLQIIKLPKMEEEEIKKAVFFEAENYVPLPINEVYLDFQTVPPLYGNLDHTDVLIAALPQKTVDPYLGCLKSAGLKPVVLEIESQAIARTLIKNEVANSPTLLIDFGAMRTSFIIFSGHSLKFTTSIQISSNSFTEIISRNLNIDFQEAEKLKIKYGLEEKTKLKSKIAGSAAKERGEIFESLVPALTDLSEQIKKYLNFYQNHSEHDHLSPDNKNVKNILISGGGSNLKGLAEFLSLDLNIPVSLANPWVNILPDKVKEDKNLSLEKALGFTTALGLALRGAKYQL
jgi:type IV pilus assembly protein PilM